MYLVFFFLFSKYTMFFVVVLFCRDRDRLSDRQTDRQIDGKRYTIIAYNPLCH